MLWRKQGRRDSRSASIHVEIAQDSKGSSHGDSIEGLQCVSYNLCMDKC